MVSPGRAELFAAVLAVAGINGVALQMGALVAAQGWLAAGTQLFGISAIVWFGFYALVRLGLDAPRGIAPTRLDWGLCAAALAMAFVPAQAPPKLAMVGLALWLLVTARHRDERGVALIALALTGALVWGPLLLQLLGQDMLGVDAAIAAFLSGNEARGNLVVTPGSAPDILILPGCSALKNVASVFVIAAALSQLERMPPNRLLALACALGVVAVVAVNSLRLALLANYPQHYTYLHEGGGATLFSYATMLVAVAIVGAAILRDRGAQRRTGQERTGQERTGQRAV